MRRWPLSGAFAVGLMLSIAPSTQTWADPEIGRALVTQYCAGCHAIGAGGESPHPNAPAFHTLSERYPIDALEETFVDRIDTGHAAMPVFEASPNQIADILDYIASVMENE